MKSASDAGKKTYATGKKATLTTIDWIVFAVKLPFFIVFFTLSLPIMVIGFVIALIMCPLQCCGASCKEGFHKGWDFIYSPGCIIRTFNFEKYEVFTCFPDPALRIRH